MNEPHILYADEDIGERISVVMVMPVGRYVQGFFVKDRRCRASAAADTVHRVWAKG